MSRAVIRARRPIAALVVAVGLLAACSDEDSGSAEDGASAPASTVNPTVSDPVEVPTDDDGESATESKEAQVARSVEDVDAPAGVQPADFSTATVRITSDDGEVCEVCVWWAATVEERSRGLMGVTDLGEPVGMAFRFDEPVDGRFWMFGTPMPLSIAWFDESGAYVGQADMEPCITADSAECARYGPGAEYLTALEMVQGELDALGVGPGSTLDVLDQHEACP